MSEARYLVGDVFDRMAELSDGSVDLIVTSPPFLALRSYLPTDHPDKHKEIGSEATPAAFLSTLLALTREWRRILAPHGSICVELGDTYSGSGGAGGDYGEGGLREGQPTWTQYARTAGCGSANDSDSDVATIAPSGSPRSSSESKRGVDAKNRGNTSRGTARRQRENTDAWPLAKSLCLLPTLYPASLAYGRNLLNPDDTIEPWRIRNLIVWHRPNPPVGALGDKVRPSTSYITTACVSSSRWFDLDAERTDLKNPACEGASREKGEKYRSLPGDGISDSDGTGRRAQFAVNRSNPAGAPPLDAWFDTTSQDVWTIPTAPFSGWGETVRHVRVPADAGDDGSQRTTSPDCPVHGSPDHPGSTPRGDARATGSSSRNGHNGDHPALELAADSPPTSSTPAPTASDADPDVHAATRHNTSSSRTAHVPSTSPVDTPSAQTPDRTFYISGVPVSSVPHPDTPESSTSSDDPSANPAPRNASRTADNPSEPGEAACTCSYYRVTTITERTSHYATFPPALPRRLINLMCPRQVCVVCGEPRRRIVESERVDANGIINPPRIPPGRAADPGITFTGNVNGGSNAITTTRNTLGWSDCGHNTWRRGIVCDPFAGSGTTLMAASELGRDSIGIDLDPRNLELARQRLGMFLVEDEIVA